MPQFQPDQVAFGDIPGYGAWDIGHAREHIQFVQALAAQSPPFNMPDYNLLIFLSAGGARSSIVQSHSDAHNILHAQLGITATDLSQVNLDDPNSFYDWTGQHATYHAQIRQILNLT